jgi:hypothetical protein
MEPLLQFLNISLKRKFCIFINIKIFTISIKMKRRPAVFYTRGRILSPGRRQTNSIRHKNLGGAQSTSGRAPLALVVDWGELSPSGKFSEAPETRFSGRVRDGLRWPEFTDCFKKIM